MNKFIYRLKLFIFHRNYKEILQRNTHTNMFKIKKLAEMLRIPKPTIFIFKRQKTLALLELPFKRYNLTYNKAYMLF